jgi:cell division protein FtsB
MNGQLVQALLTLVGVLAASYFTYRASIRANRTAQLTAIATQQNADEARMKRMREDLSAAEEECAKLRRQVAVLTREAEAAVAELQFLRRSIWRDGMTLERLREFVGQERPPSPNGSR